MEPHYYSSLLLQICTTISPQPPPPCLRPRECGTEAGQHQAKEFFSGPQCSWVGLIWDQVMEQ